MGAMIRCTPVAVGVAIVADDGAWQRRPRRRIRRLELSYAENDKSTRKKPTTD